MLKSWIFYGHFGMESVPDPLAMKGDLYPGPFFYVGLSAYFHDMMMIFSSFCHFLVFWTILDGNNCVFSPLIIQGAKIDAHVIWWYSGYKPGTRDETTVHVPGLKWTQSFFDVQYLKLNLCWGKLKRKVGKWNVSVCHVLNMPRKVPNYSVVRIRTLHSKKSWKSIMNLVDLLTPKWRWLTAAWGYLPMPLDWIPCVMGLCNHWHVHHLGGSW